jgi:PAS domain S-box-containing protein
MIPHYLFDNTQPPLRNRFWILSGLTVLVTAVNYIALSQGISVVFSQFFYLPIILTGYWYPRRGVAFSACIAIVYAAIAIAAGPQEVFLGFTVMARCIIFIIVGAVVSYLASSLRVSEQQLHEIIEFLPDPTFAIDKDGMVIAWNRAIEGLTGIRKEDMLGRGNHAYAIPFYGERRPILVDLILDPEKKPEDAYADVKREVSAYSTGVFIPHLHEGKGAHLRISATVLTDADGKITGGIEVIHDITQQVMLQSALQTTGSRLNILAGIVRNDIAKRLTVLYGHLSIGVMKFNDPDVLTFIANIQDSANAIQRQVEISREFRDIGTTPPVWIPVLEASTAAAEKSDLSRLAFRSWTARLEVFTDPHIPTVFYHIFENSKKEGKEADRVIVTYQITGRGCTIIIEDNGKGIPEASKESLFTQRSETFGCGLFLAHEILILTGVGIRETGIPGRGIRFEILVPPEGYRIRGTAKVPDAAIGGLLQAPGYVMGEDLPARPGDTAPVVRELMAEEFHLADEVWKEYHDTTGNPATDRIFAVFLEGDVVSVARCRRHTDGMEVDGIFTPAAHRQKGYSRIAVNALVEACHNDDLFMHAIRSLVSFYQSWGFESIRERDLPPTIRERYVWAAGNLEGADVEPMRRKSGF